MLDIIENAMYRFIDIASETMYDDPINDPINRVFELIKQNPKISYEEIATFGRNRRQIRAEKSVA